MAPRPALSVERIVDAAVAVADRGGLARLSMRNVGKELGVEAMSLYHHVANKEALLDALAEWAFAQIELPAASDPWRAAMAARASSARAVLAAHPWALGLLESRRSPGPALLAHHESVLACLRANGFSVPLATHAFSAIDAYVHGFVLTELTIPVGVGEPVTEFVAEVAELMPAEAYPHLAEMIAEQVVGQTYVFGDEFAFGLDLILDGLERQLEGPG
jgi:AcrR family transcriptional regulator